MVDKNDFNKNASHPLQSWEWGEFRKKTGNQVYRTKNYQLTIHPFIFGFKIGALIKGPAPTQKMLTELQEIAKQENLIFIKLEPNVPKNDKDIEILSLGGAVAGKTLFTPTTFTIDLTKSEDELLKSFSSKTRYNIKVAQKHGVTVVEDNSDQAFEKYLDLTFETAKRQGFFAHNRKYHELMWNTLNKDPRSKGQDSIAHLLVAKYDSNIISTWVLFVWKDTLYYPYGASSDKYKNTMANNLMMWEAIRLGKKLNLKTFDLWGREEGKGFTKFKEGYNPQVVEFLGSWDLVTNKPVYYLYKIAEKVRWIILRVKSKFVRPKF